MTSNSSLMSRLGLGAAFLALIAFLVPVVYALLGATGAVQLNTADDIKNLLTGAVIVGIIALALAVVATLLNLPGLFADPRHSVGALIGSALLLLLSAGFLFGMALPRAAAVQNLQDNIIPFAQTMNDNCAVPLNDTVEDLTTMRNFADTTKASDAGYAGGAGTYISVLRLDDAKLADGIQAVQLTTVPDPKYQTLKDECLKSLKGMLNFLDNAQAVPLPSPFDKLIAPTVSGFTLLNTSVALAASGKLPPGTVQPLISQALTQVINTKNPALTTAANMLSQDIKGNLNNYLAPFAVPNVCSGRSGCSRVPIPTV
jgi:hypothetical protein